MTFPSPKPRLSPVVYGLIVLAVVGLLALGIAAYTAFIRVAGTVQALAAAVLIEAVMVLEAMAIIRRNRWAIGGVVVSLVVSVTYNYIQAQQAGAIHGLSNWWQLGTLAVGPLSALLFLALTIGHELNRHELRTAQWAVDRQTWLLEKSAKVEGDRKEREEREMHERLEMERIARQAETEKARALAEVESKADVAKFRAELRQDGRQLSDSSGNLPKVSDWRSLPAEDRALIAGMTTPQVAERYGVSERTARNWKKNASPNGVAH